MDAASKMTARTVIHSNGLARRVLLNQPPGFRRGTDPVPAIDGVTRAVERVLRNSKNDVIERAMRRNPN